MAYGMDFVGRFGYADPTAAAAAAIQYSRADCSVRRVLPTPKAQGAELLWDNHPYAPASLWLPALLLLKALASSATGGWVDATFHGIEREQVRIHAGGREESLGLTPPPAVAPAAPVGPPAPTVGEWLRLELPAVRERLADELAREMSRAGFASGLSATALNGWIAVSGHADPPDVMLEERGDVLRVRTLLPPGKDARRVLRRLKSFLLARGARIAPGAAGR